MAMYQRSLLSQPGAVPFNIGDLVRHPGRRRGAGQAAAAGGRLGRQLQLHSRGGGRQALASQEEDEEGDEEEDEEEEVSGEEEVEDEEGQGIDLGPTQGLAPSQYFSALRQEDADEELEDFIVGDEEEGSGDGNDDWCSCCRLGGELLCCDGCSSAYHLACVGLKELPGGGSWWCPECTLARMKKKRKLAQRKALKLAQRRAGRALTDS
jgi:hypothetical protein